MGDDLRNLDCFGREVCPTKIRRHPLPEPRRRAATPERNRMLCFAKPTRSMQEAKPVVSSCIVLSPSDSYGSNSSKEASDGWSENGFRSNRTRNPFNLTRIERIRLRSRTRGSGRRPGRGRRGGGRRHNKGTIMVTIRALERQKEPSVTPIFCKLRQNTVLSRHSREFSGIDGHREERTVPVGNRIMWGRSSAGWNAYLSRRRLRVQMPLLSPELFAAPILNFLFGFERPITGYLKHGCADRSPLAFHAYFLHAVRRPKTSRRHGEGWISDEI